MASFYIPPNGSVTYTAAASDKLATYSPGSYSVAQVVGYPNRPQIKSSLFSSSGSNTTSAFSAATTVTIQAGPTYGVYYQTGTGPVITEIRDIFGTQATPGALDATGTLTAALMLGGIVTSSTAAAVAATVDTGATMDAVIDIPTDGYFDWSAINTGGTNAFTVTASSGHTLVGSGAVAANSAVMFRTRRTAASTWVTYRMT